MVDKNPYLWYSIALLKQYMKLPIQLKTKYSQIGQYLKEKLKVNKIFLNISGLLMGMQIIVPLYHPIAINADKLISVASAKEISLTADYPNSFPTTGERPIRTMVVPVTAYNSLPGQTDSTPCFTANDYDLCTNNREDVIATNFLPMGTRIKFPELYGDKIFTVQDRMNARYHYNTDIWMKSHADAVKFGLKHTTIEIYKD